MMTKVRVVPESTFTAWLNGSNTSNFAAKDTTIKTFNKPDVDSLGMNKSNR
jgi:heme/copper-type cytochrome/quinol oxidase subunit 2